MASIKQALQYTTENPNSDYAREFRRRLDNGLLDGEIKSEGLQKQQISQQIGNAITAQTQRAAKTNSIMTAAGADKTPAGERGGLAGDIVRGIARPFLRTGLSAIAPIQATFELARGNRAAADRALGERDLGFFGKVKPVGVSTDPTARGFKNQARATLSGLRDVVGTGAELAAFRGAGGTLGRTAASVARKTMLKGIIKKGAIEGGLAGFGAGEQEAAATGDLTLGSVAKTGLSTAFGTAAGVALSGIVPVVRTSPAVRQAVGKLGRGIKRGTERIVRTGEDAAEREIKIKALPKKVQSSARETVETGIEESTVNLITSAQKEDVSIFKRILNKALAIKKDTKARRTVNPKEELGRVVLAPAKHLLKESEDAAGARSEEHTSELQSH